MHRPGGPLILDVPFLHFYAVHHPIKTRQIFLYHFHCINESASEFVAQSPPTTVLNLQQ